MPIRTLALDLERTLISDAMNREARPGLHAFLSFCLARFPRIVLFTCVSKAQAQDVVAELVREGHAPPAFAERLEYTSWHGSYKDLRFVPDAAPEEILLVDDDAGWVAPGQEARYIAIAEYDPYLVRGEDRELARVRTMLEFRCKEAESSLRLDLPMS